MFVRSCDGSERCRLLLNTWRSLQLCILKILFLAAKDQENAQLNRPCETCLLTTAVFILSDLRC